MKFASQGIKQFSVDVESNSSDTIWFGLACYMIGLQDLCHPPDQSDAKVKPIATWSPAYSRLFHFEFSFVLVVFSFAFIGRSNNFGFGFTKLNQNVPFYRIMRNYLRVLILRHSLRRGSGQLRRFLHYLTYSPWCWQFPPGGCTLLGVGGAAFLTRFSHQRFLGWRWRLVLVRLDRNAWRYIVITCCRLWF